MTKKWVSDYCLTPNDQFYSLSFDPTGAWTHTLANSRRTRQPLHHRYDYEEKKKTTIYKTPHGKIKL